MVSAGVKLPRWNTALICTGRQTSSGGPAQVTVEGYNCVRVRSVQEPLPQAFYECTSGTKKVTFTRS